jgi:hypothetical protein
LNDVCVYIQSIWIYVATCCVCVSVRLSVCLSVCLSVSVCVCAYAFAFALRVSVCLCGCVCAIEIHARIHRCRGTSCRVPCTLTRVLQCAVPPVMARPHAPLTTPPRRCSKAHMHDLHTVDIMYTCSHSEISAGDTQRAGTSRRGACSCS